MTRVTIQDLRDARYCLAGVRPWFRRHGFDWQVFLTHGIEVDRLRVTGDALIEPVIAAAERRRAAGAASRETTGSTVVHGRTEADHGR